jgi:hypothetical protein
MEEMHRTHKEPVWGWAAVVADVIAWIRQPRPRTPAKRPSRTGVVTPWSTNTPPGWSA